MLRPTRTERVTARRPADREQALLGDAVREVRKAQGLTQKQVADRTGVHVTYLSDIERGARNPSWKVIASLAAGMGVPTAHIAQSYDALAAQRAQDTGHHGPR
jgi:transcriptional regulator with XRE-family HTH domain